MCVEETRANLGPVTMYPAAIQIDGIKWDADVMRARSELSTRLTRRPPYRKANCNQINGLVLQRAALVQLFWGVE